MFPTITMNTVRQSGCLLRRFALQKISLSRPVHVGSKMNSIYEKDDKGGYRKNYLDEMPSRTEMIREGFKELKSEILLWKEEMREKFACDPLIVARKGEVDVKWQFTNPEVYKQFLLVSDKDHEEGFSHCELKQSPAGKGLFTGYLDTRIPKDGIVKKAGFCAMRTARAKKSFKRDAYLDWSMYNTLVLRVRGDGRTYSLNIANKGYFDNSWNDVYTFLLYTRGGPYWQYTRIPFSKFFFTHKGRVQDEQSPVFLERVTSFGITLADQTVGNFNLEIDYIGLAYDPGHTEEFAYELYKHDNYIVQN